MTTANSTSIHYGTDHLCKKHQVLFNLEHIEKCDYFSGYNDIRKYANNLKDQHILDWDKDDRLHGIALFAYLTVQMMNLLRSKEAILVVNKPLTTYVKSGRRPGRPKKTE